MRRPPGPARDEAIHDWIRLSGILGATRTSKYALLVRRIDDK
jgi:hypothetical protein